MIKNIEVLIAEVDKLDDQIFELNQTIANDIAVLSSKKIEVQGILDDELSKEAASLLSDKDYGCGTANIETARHKIKVTVSKKVKWDEGELRVVRNLILAADGDPSIYIKEKLSVSETEYKGFPQHIQDAFEPARSVEPSAPKITIERK